MQEESPGSIPVTLESDTGARTVDAFKAILDLPKAELEAHTEKGRLLEQVDQDTRTVLDFLRSEDKRVDETPAVSNLGAPKPKDSVEVQVVDETETTPGILAIARIAADGTGRRLSINLRPVVNSEPLGSEIKDSQFLLTEGYPANVEEVGRAGEMVMDPRDANKGETHSIGDQTGGSQTYQQMAGVLAKLAEVVRSPAA